MKRIVPVLFGLVLMAAAGCSMHGKQAGEVWLPFATFNNLNPAYWQAQHLIAQGTLYEGLFGYAPDPTGGGLGGQKIVPAIASSWSMSGGGSRWTFHLRRDKKWSNGDPVTARDFVRSYRFYASPDPAMKDVPYWAGPIQFLKNAWAIKSGAKKLEELGVS